MHFTERYSNYQGGPLDRVKSVAEQLETEMLKKYFLEVERAGEQQFFDIFLHKGS